MRMKLRQGMLTEDIVDCFDAWSGLASNIIITWVKAASTVVQPMIFVSDRQKIHESFQNWFKSLPEIHSILDGKEVFIETT